MTNQETDTIEELLHQAANQWHSENNGYLCNHAVQTAAEQTAKLIERTLPETLTPYQIAKYCISVYFAALPMEFDFPPKSNGGS